MFTLPFAGLVEQVPTAALAGLLIVIRVRPPKPAHIETARRNGDFAVHLVTALGVVFLNLLHGVVIGLALATGLTGWRVIRAKIEAEDVGDEWRVVVQGACTEVVAAIPAGTTATVGMSADHLDHAHASSDWRLAATTSRHRRDGSHHRVAGLRGLARPIAT